MPSQARPSGQSRVYRSQGGGTEDVHVSPLILCRHAPFKKGIDNDLTQERPGNGCDTLSHCAQTARISTAGATCIDMNRSRQRSVSPALPGRPTHPNPPSRAHPGTPRTNTGLPGRAHDRRSPPGTVGSVPKRPPLHHPHPVTHETRSKPLLISPAPPATPRPPDRLRRHEPPSKPNNAHRRRIIFVPWLTHKRRNSRNSVPHPTTSRYSLLKSQTQQTQTISLRRRPRARFSPELKTPVSQNYGCPMSGGWLIQDPSRGNTPAVWLARF